MKDIPDTRRMPEQRAAVLPDDEGLAETRVRFLTAEPVSSQDVREPILASWCRSRGFHVPADRIELPYFSDQDLDTPLIHSADPILARLGDQLEGQPISMIVTDPSGVVLSQRTGDPDLQRHLEGVELSPGFSYSEQFVGTNGIGTALEGGGPMHVFGHEHYAENLENLACAGVPIRHPISGRMIGALDLTCWRKDAGQLLIALARTTAEQIRQALLTTSSISELELFRAYLQACRRSTGIVMAINDDVVMMNDYARKLLAAEDQSMLLREASQALVERRRGPVDVTLPSGKRARVRCRRVSDPSGRTTAGGVLHARLLAVDEEDPVHAAVPAMPTFVPGLVGSAPLWLRCCHDVDTSCGANEWLVLAGEPGVGKYVLARCVHRRRHPTGRLQMLDAVQATNSSSVDDVARELINGEADALVLRHVDRLGGSAATELAATLRQVQQIQGANAPWIAVTVSPDAELNPDLAALLALFPRTVTVPPLRHHIEDLRELVPFFLSKLGHGGELSCSPRTMQLLMRSTWPGNATELYEVLKHVTQHRRRTGVIHPDDLPAECRAVTRRALNQLESMERDAIITSLEDAGGNKVQAAKNLGISRATIYRKIHEYGIISPGPGAQA